LTIVDVEAGQSLIPFVAKDQILTPATNNRQIRNIAHARELLDIPAPVFEPDEDLNDEPGEPAALSHPCPCCGGRMIIIETFERGAQPRASPGTPSRIASA
jgi:hypothetical protein